MYTRPWNPDKPEVPVDKNGNWLAYPDYRQETWEPVRPFFAVMTIDGMETGRSAKRVILKDDKGKKYPMFVSDLIDGIKKGTFDVFSEIGGGSDGEGGRISSWWTASKRGANYGIKATKQRTNLWQ